MRNGWSVMKNDLLFQDLNLRSLDLLCWPLDSYLVINQRFFFNIWGFSKNLYATFVVTIVKKSRIFINYSSKIQNHFSRMFNKCFCCILKTGDPVNMQFQLYFNCLICLEWSLYGSLDFINTCSVSLEICIIVSIEVI